MTAIFKLSKIFILFDILASAYILPEYDSNLFYFILVVEIDMSKIGTN